MIREWVEARLVSARTAIGRGAERGGLSGTLQTHWIELIYIIGVVVMVGGIVSALVSPVDYRYIIYPGRDGQSISETVINGMALLMGFGGFYMAYLSGRQTVKPRLVGFYLAIGLLLIATGLYIEMFVYTSK